MKLSKYFLLIFSIALVLFLIPFFWFPVGSLDLGGDSTRLFFYDPINYIQNYTLYAVSLTGKGGVESHSYDLTFTLLLLLLKNIFHSSWFLIALVNGFKLSGSFVFIYLIVKELIDSPEKKNRLVVEVSAILAGLFYIYYPNGTNLWDRALINHNQIVLNPLLFYLFLRYCLTKKNIYLLLLIFISFIFASNFSWASAPVFFSFYPLSFLFILIYTIWIKNKKISVSYLFLGLILFLGIHAFHLIPAFFDLVNPGGNTFSRLFDHDIVQKQIDYFSAVVSSASISNTVILPGKSNAFPIFGIVSLIAIISYLKNKKNYTYVLTGLFLLLSFYLLTAKIGYIGEKIYIFLLLHLPGFTMFRNFVDQWFFLSAFFYTLLLGQGIFILAKSWKTRQIIVFFIVLCALFTFAGKDTLNGSFVYKYYQFAPHTKNAVVLDSSFKSTTSFLAKLPDDAKIITFPYTDYNYQVFFGNNNEAYVGTSTIPFLTGKKDFPGYFDTLPFSDVFLRLAKEKNFVAIAKLLQIMNIHYIFYNEDKRIYDTEFIKYPNEYMRPYIANNQNEYKKFISAISSKRIFHQGTYSVYSINSYIPHIYTSNNIIMYTKSQNTEFGKEYTFFETNQDVSVSPIYIEKNICEDKTVPCSSIRSNNTPTITFQKINPTRYNITIKNATYPYVLVLQDPYHSNWRIYDSSTNANNSKILVFLGRFGEFISRIFHLDVRANNHFVTNFENGKIREKSPQNIFLDINTFETWGKKTIGTHISVNGYANGWVITPKDMPKKDYNLVIEQDNQKVFYVSLLVSLLSLCIVIFLILLDVVKMIKIPLVRRFRSL